MECAKELGVQIVGVKWVTSLFSAGWADVYVMCSRFRTTAQKDFFSPFFGTLFYRDLEIKLFGSWVSASKQSTNIQAKTGVKQSNYYWCGSGLKQSIKNLLVLKQGLKSFLILSLLLNFHSNLIFIFSSIK